MGWCGCLFLRSYHFRLHRNDVDGWRLTVDCWRLTVNSELEFTIPMLTDLISTFIYNLSQLEIKNNIMCGKVPIIKVVCSNDFSLISFPVTPEWCWLLTVDCWLEFTIAMLTDLILLAKSFNKWVFVLTTNLWCLYRRTWYNIMSDRLTLISRSGRVFEMGDCGPVLLANPPLQKSRSLDRTWYNHWLITND